MKIGAKARVIAQQSVYSEENVSLIREEDNEYIFTNEKHKCGTLIVNKNLAHDFIVWECSSDGKE